MRPLPPLPNKPTVPDAAPIPPSSASPGPVEGWSWPAAPAAAPTSPAGPVLVGPSTVDPGATTLAGSGFIPAGDRSALRAARRLATRREAATRSARAELVKGEKARDMAENRSVDWLPRRGTKGPDAGRTVGRLRLRPHKATSDVLSVAYPFLAEAGIGSSGPWIGTDSWSGSSFCFDPWELYKRGVLTNPNVLLAGVIGRGKTTLSASLVVRSLAFDRQAFIPGDLKGEWAFLVHALEEMAARREKRFSGAVLALGPGMATRLNPLDAGPRPAMMIGPTGGREAMTDQAWTDIVHNRRSALLTALAITGTGRDLSPVEGTALAAGLVEAERRPDPMLPHVVAALLDPPVDGVRGSTRAQLIEDGRPVAHALLALVEGDLKGMFDGASTTTLDTTCDITVADLSRIHGSDTRLALVQTCVSSWMEAALMDPESPNRWVVYDEAWRLMRLPALLSRMQSQWKLSRALGIANLLVIHRLSDLDSVGDEGSSMREQALGLLADCSSRILYAQEADQAAKTGAAIGLTTTEMDQLSALDKGEGLWKLGGRSFMVRHRVPASELTLLPDRMR